MPRFNISQSTYDRLLNQLSMDTGSGAMRVHRQDLRDLLAAYENASELLDAVACQTISDESAEAAEFLYLESGAPRVQLDGENVEGV